MSAESTGDKQRKRPVGKPFQPGQSGNPAGRPKGSRNALAEDFLKDVHADWQKFGIGALKAVREQRPDVYVKVVSELLPKIEQKTEDVNVNVSGSIEHRGLPEISERVTELLAGRAADAGTPLRTH